MEHDFLVGDVGVVVLIVIEGHEDRMVLVGIANERVFLLLLVGAVEHHVVLALNAVLVALHVAHQHELRVL